ncbi:MAG: hypothetical protein AAGH82_07655 [Pseudomonadota bacterium]
MPSPTQIAPAEIAKAHNWPHFKNLALNAALDIGMTVVSGSGNSNAVSAQLVQAKARASQTFISGQIETPGDFPALSGQWSDFAADTLDTALAAAWQTPRVKKLTRNAPDDGTVPGLFVLGLGKLGGRDLNYSSDVDLVAFFDTEAVPVPAHEGRTYVCDMVLKAMTQTISGKTDTDRIWRVDWRLRPDPSVTGLSMATDAALDFFAFRSAPWRRLAMMKARVVAGDKQAGAAFLKRLNAFIWRQTLDFRTLDEIAAVKDRIKNEHPGLAATGPAATDIAVADDFHIKLGSGGIREIEFIVNAQQLIWGGRQHQLRTTNTLDALAVCAELGHLETEQAYRLREAYIWLRRLENSVQMIADRQTHTVPDAPEDRALATAIMGEDNWVYLTKNLTKHRAVVAERFERFLHDEEQVPPQGARRVPSNISDASEAIIETWQAGFLAHGAAPDQNLSRLSAALLDASARQKDPDRAISNVDRFLQSLPRGGQYLRLLASHSGLTSDIFSAFLTSAPIASLMEQSPHVVDVLMERGGSTELRLADDAELLARANALPDEEARLEWIRAWTNERLFLAYLGSVSKQRSAQTIAREITAIAERALHLSTVLTAKHLGVEQVPVSIVAFGRLGMAAMHPGSDLDLMFLAEGDDANDLDRANRFSLRLKSTLDTRMRAGQVWEIDMRLRPSGRAGPPTLRPISFRTHQLERAKTWEHIALVPARFVCGSADSRAMFDTTRTACLTTARDQSQLDRDAASMLGLLRTERIAAQPADPYEVKLITGGLMEAEFLLHALVLRHAADHPHLAQTTYADLPSALAGIEPELAPLKDGLRTLSDMQFEARLHGAGALADLCSESDWHKRREPARNAVLEMLDQQLPPLVATDEPDAAISWL